MMKIIPIASSLIGAKQLDKLDIEISEVEEELNFDILETNIELALEKTQHMQELLFKIQALIEKLNKNIVKLEDESDNISNVRTARIINNPYHIKGQVDMVESRLYFEALQEKIDLVNDFFVPIIKELRRDCPLKAFIIAKKFLEGNEFYNIKDQLNLEDMAFPYINFLFTLKSINIGLSQEEADMLLQAKSFRYNKLINKNARENILTIMASLIEFKDIELKDKIIKEENRDRNKGIEIGGRNSSEESKTQYQNKIDKFVGLFPHFEEGDYFEHDCMLDSIFVDYIPKQIIDDINGSIFKAVEVEAKKFNYNSNYAQKAQAYKEYLDLIDAAKKAIFKGEIKAVESLANDLMAHIAKCSQEEYQPSVIISQEEKFSSLSALQDFLIPALKALEKEGSKEAINEAYALTIKHLEGKHSFLKFKGEPGTMLLDMQCERYAKSIIGLKANLDSNYNFSNASGRDEKKDEKLLKAIDLFSQEQMFDTDPFADFLIAWFNADFENTASHSKPVKPMSAKEERAKKQLLEIFIDRFALPSIGETFSKDYEIDKNLKKHASVEMVEAIDIHISNMTGQSINKSGDSLNHNDSSTRGPKIKP